MNRRINVEICVGDVASAIAAEAGGADRVELCDNLAVGGTTPSAGTIAESCRRLSIPVHVLIRPRGRRFRLFGSGDRGHAARHRNGQGARGCGGRPGCSDARGEPSIASRPRRLIALGQAALTSLSIRHLTRWLSRWKPSTR